jgi:hypothetical protein
LLASKPIAASKDAIACDRNGPHGYHIVTSNDDEIGVEQRIDFDD